MTLKHTYAVLIDLSGTIHIEDLATDGAIEAMKNLRSCSDVTVKFVTNTTKVIRIFYYNFS